MLVEGGNFIIQGYTLLNENFACYDSSALEISVTNFRYESMNNIAIFSDNFNNVVSSSLSNRSFIGTIHFYGNRI